MNSGDARTPLHVACEANHVEVVSYIISECVNASRYFIKNMGTKAALKTAVERKHWKCVQIIAESGHCNLNRPDSKGNTFLHQAVATNDLEGVKTLVSNPLCDPMLSNRRGETPLCIALKNHSFSAALTIVCSNRDYVNSPDSSGNLFLHYAVTSEDVELTARILSYDSCDPNVVNKGGETPLHICCRQLTGTDAIFKMLTEDQRYNPNVQDHRGNTALHNAIQSFQISHVKVLIDKKCDPSLRNEDGNTPLHIACMKGAKCKHGNSGKVIVSMLLYAGKVDPECLNNGEVTPIELAGTNYSIIREIRHFLQSKSKIETYTNLVMLGNVSTGKSTLMKAICAEASKLLRFAPTRYKLVRGVDYHTAGIISTLFQSNRFGNTVLYDFAGQHAYYFSYHFRLHLW